MKNFFKKIAIFLGIIAAVSATSSLVSPTSTYARTFLGMPSWDDGVNLDVGSENELTTAIAGIATNILSDISIVASYLALGFVVYGGYLYMFSSGDPVKAAAGKKTLTHAFIGLAISMSAFVIFGAIRAALMGDKSFGDCNALNMTECIDGGVVVSNLINWVIAMGGVVSVIFIVIGAWSYMTAAGDPQKLQKAKTTILYSLIGLVIVALSLVLTSFISGLVRQSSSESPQSYIENTSTIELANINKEEK